VFKLPCLNDPDTSNDPEIIALPVYGKSELPAAVGAHDADKAYEADVAVVAIDADAARVAYEADVAIDADVAKLAVPISCGDVMFPVVVTLPENVADPLEISPFLMMNSFAMYLFPIQDYLFTYKYPE
jgi:hypothetical protein